MTKLGTLLIVLCVACGSKHQPAPAPSNKAPAPAAWDDQLTTFMTRLADAIDASAGDCDKLATGLEGLEPAAKSTREAMVASKHTFRDYKLPADLDARMQKVDPTLFDRCEKQNARANKALDLTLLTIAPLSEDPGLGSAAGDALGEAAAVK